MQINIPSSEAEKLTRHATAAGFDNVEMYVTEFVRTLAERPAANDLFAPLTDDELAVSLAMIDRGMSEIDAGQGMSVDEARLKTLEQFRADNR